MGAVAKWKALPPWARHMRWLSVVLTTSPWVVLQFARFLPYWLMPMVLLGYAAIGVQSLLPQTVEVGEDGVMLRSVGLRRFIRYDRIEVVTATALGVKLLLRNGREVEIRLTQKDNAEAARVDALVAAIENGREAFEEDAHAEEEALLVRGTRDLDTWSKDMRAIGEGQRSGYRALAIPEERLWRVLESASADPSAREGAAIALHAALDDDGRERLRVAARGVAAPRLRIALETIAETKEPERVRIALEEIPDEEVESEEAEVERREKR